MFFTIDQICGQISANINIHSHPPEAYESLERLQLMLAYSVGKIRVAINFGNEEMLIILLNMLEYQQSKMRKILDDKKYRAYKKRVLKSKKG